MWHLFTFTIIASSFHLYGALRSCPVSFKKQGCFEEERTDFETLINDRYEIDWGNWENGKYPMDLACRCNDEAIKKKCSFFAIRFYGICVCLQNIKQPSSKKCLGYSFEKNCNDKEPEICIGKSLADYVYEVGVDGGYSEWSAWSNCSETCGEGLQERTRTCDNPKVRGYGKPCQGNSSDSRPCMIKKCPVDGKFTPWGPYNKCNVTCGGGTQTRSRNCTNPAPAHGGKDCTGLRIQEKSCNNQPCPVDGGFTTWSDFGKCSQTCDGGFKIRTRSCTNPKPSNGGKDCTGETENREPCKNDLCPGPTGSEKATEIVETFLKSFYKKKFPGKNHTAKFIQAVFEIQKAVRAEFDSEDPTVSNHSLDERLNSLRKFLKTATHGGSIDFARSLLGKSLFLFMKKKIKEGLPIDTLDNAANRYLENITNDIGEKKFNELIAINGDATLMFVIDTTGSMENEIKGAKNIAKTIINQKREFDVDFILSPFGDPRYGPTIHKPYSERARFVEAIGGLKAAGGLDCPELSFTGMLEAFKENPRYGSPMFVFTDANAKDNTVENTNALKAAARRSQTEINFFTNLSGCGKGIKEYEDIAQATAGNIFPLQNAGDLISLTTYVKSSLQSDTLLATYGNLEKLRRRRRAVIPSSEHAFHVDDSIGTLIVSLSVSTENTSSSVSMYDPKGKKQSPATLLAYAAVYEITNPSFGIWRLVFPQSVGTYEYYVKAISQKPIEFDHYFLIQENLKEKKPSYAVANPFTGSICKLLVQVGGLENVDRSSLKLNIKDNLGKYIMRGLAITTFGNTNGIFEANFTPPKTPFRLELSGSTKLGNKFQRIARGENKAGKALMQTLYAGADYTVKINEKSAKMEVHFVNTGVSEEFIIDISASVGLVEPSTVTTVVKSSTNVKFSYNAPLDSSLKGKTATITLTAKGMTSGSSISKSFLILLV